MWLRETHDLLRFVVAVMGRLPIVTPVAIYAAVIGSGWRDDRYRHWSVCWRVQRPLRRPWLVTAFLLLATVAATGAAYIAPAYTPEQPLRRYRPRAAGRRRAIRDLGGRVGGARARSRVPMRPGDGCRPTSSPPTSVPWGGSASRSCSGRRGRRSGPAPASVAAFTVKPLADGQQVTLSVVPREPGVTVTFVLPAGVSPARSSLPGLPRLGRWTASFIAPPPEGISWEASFRGASPEQLREIRIAISSSRLPGGTGWQSLPGWLPQETAVWSATATWIIPAAAGLGIAPVPSLR